jgi:histidinol-phosphate/aromatic aminotransferase/cobyric acid decarboxylase-like protein
MQEYINEVLNISLPMLTKFLKENNIKYWSSKANFILFYCKDSKKLTRKLEKQ